MLTVSEHKAKSLTLVTVPIKFYLQLYIYLFIYTYNYIYIPKIFIFGTVQLSLKHGSFLESQALDFFLSSKPKWFSPQVSL